MDTSFMCQEDCCLPPPEGRCGTCGRLLKLVCRTESELHKLAELCERYGVKHEAPLDPYTIERRCECGTILEISDVTLADHIVCILKKFYGIEEL